MKRDQLKSLLLGAILLAGITLPAKAQIVNNDIILQSESMAVLITALFLSSPPSSKTDFWELPEVSQHATFPKNTSL